MKLLIYVHSFAPNIGGVETVVMSLAQGLARSGTGNGSSAVRVTVVTPTPAGEMDDSTLPFQVVRRPNFAALMRLVRAADVVHLAGPCFLPMLLGLLFRKQIVVEHHGFQVICPNGQLFYEPAQMPCPGHFMAGQHRQCLRCNARAGTVASSKMWLLTFARRWLAHYAAVNITPTRWLESLLHLARTTTVHHGVKNGARETRAGTRDAPPTFVFNGRLVATKGAHVLLRAAERLKTKGLAFRVKFVGEGPERSHLEAQAEALQLTDRVTFLGYVPPGALEQALAESTAIVMPSLGGEEFGLVATVNMMRGHMLIVSEIGALTEVVGEAGLRFPPGDVEGLAGCLEDALEPSGWVSTRRKRASERAIELFSERRMVDEHLALYRRLLVNGGPAC